MQTQLPRGVGLYSVLALRCDQRSAGYFEYSGQRICLFTGGVQLFPFEVAGSESLFRFDVGHDDDSASGDNDSLFSHH